VSESDWTSDSGLYPTKDDETARWCPLNTAEKDASDQTHQRQTWVFLAFTVTFRTS